ncbi:protein-arginine deiminase type-4-like [Puma concolor]|uniref:Protein-arginine deiminase type-4-like n=1 Tax=Puma concolor TaxID=9696 RepID=A0A6P6I0W1_PUMCO|nr:protein-arginine deiminase type-4-like [Puma concolor]
MAQGTVIHVAPEEPTYAVCVLGTESQLDVYRPDICGPRWCPRDCLGHFLQSGTAASTWTAVQISYYGSKTSPIQALLYVTGVEISLSADITRTGKVKPAGAQKGQVPGLTQEQKFGLGSGPEHGARRRHGETQHWSQVLSGCCVTVDLQDMSLVTLNTNTPRDFFARHQLLLHVAKSEMDKVRVFQASRGNQISRYREVLGPKQPCHPLELPGGQHSTDFYVEGLAFPDANFPGLISLAVSLLDTSNPELPKTLIFQDSVVFRVAPWIMTPNTQPPEEVYVCRMLENEDFLKSVTALTQEAKCQLTVCTREQSVGDRWMQDEIEVGYIQAPHKTLPVVFRVQNMVKGITLGFRYKMRPVPARSSTDVIVRENDALGPDFGYVTRGPQTGEVSDLDSFGNLEVSPPVKVGRKKYPLGRILIGSSCYPSKESQEMHQALQDFLSAQQVQAPVKLYSDWLFVGHVDEFLSFVPVHKGFRLLLASPRSCYRLFQEQLKEGHGEALLFEGVKKKKQKIKDVLSNEKLREDNSYVQVPAWVPETPQSGQT